MGGQASHFHDPQRYRFMGKHNQVSSYFDKTNNATVLEKTVRFFELPQLDRFVAVLGFRCACAPHVFGVLFWKQEEDKGLCSTSWSMRVFLEQPACRLDEIRLRTVEELAICVRDSLIGFYTLRKYFKTTFAVREGQVYLGKNYNVLVWINQDLFTNHFHEGQTPGSETAMILEIIGMVSRRGDQQLPPVFTRDLSGTLQFEKVIKLLSVWLNGRVEPGLQQTLLVGVDKRKEESLFKSFREDRADESLKLGARGKVEGQLLKAAMEQHFN